MADKAKPEVVRPTSQVDLEERLDADFQVRGPDVPPVDEDGKLTSEENPAFEVEGNDRSAYVGVDPIYQNYANETEKPYAFEGVEGEAVDRMLGNQFAVGRDKPVESEHTLGGGSNDETIYTHVSGTDFVPEVVDRAKVQVENEKAQAEATQPVTEAPVAKKAAAPATPSKS